MRTFHWNAPIIMGAGALVLALSVPAPVPVQAGTQEIAIAFGKQAKQARLIPDGSVALNDFRADLAASDRIIAEKALEIALSEIGDGATLVWRQPLHGLTGRIKPVSAFRDDKGRICRHVIYSLTLAERERQVEGNACRGQDGHWSIGG